MKTSGTSWREPWRLRPQLGSILLLVLVALVMMSLATGSYLVLMHNEHVATRYGGHHQQVRLLTESGIEYLRLFVAQSDTLIYQQGGWQNNPGKMQGILVADDALADYRGRFTVVAPDMVQGYYSGVRYGLENESGKLNLNTLVGTGGGDEGEPRERLLALPGMTESVADAILDWLDADNLPRDFGAEDSYYQSLDPPYKSRNGPISSLDELLLVRGVTSELLYGLDANRNFQVDTNEVSRGALTLVDNFSGQMNRGWSAYVTLNSMEQLETPAGERKINLNSRNLQQLFNDLSTALGEPAAKFIIAYRQFADAGEEEAGTAQEIGSLAIDFQKEAQRQIESLLDLVGARIAVQDNEQAPPAIYESPWKDDPATYRQSLLELLDVASVQRGRRISGRVNINIAARPVLMTIPGITELVADQIISRRTVDLDPTLGYQRHPVWILADGIVTKEQMQELDPFVTADGDVFSCQIVGFFEAAPPQARVEIVLDGSGRNTRLASWQDLGPLGPGFARGVLWGESVGPR